MDLKFVYKQLLDGHKAYKTTLSLTQCQRERLIGLILASVIFLATFNYRVSGTCLPTRAFHARLAREAGITLKANQIVLTARRRFFSDSSLQCLQQKAITIDVFAKKNQLACGEYLKSIKKN